MLLIWGRPNSHNVKKVAWFVEEVGLPYERRDVGGLFGFPEEYTQLNPNRLIPTIEHDGVVLWESNTILRYLAAQHAPAFWPESPAARAVGEKWMDWQFDYAEAQRDAFVNLVRRPPAKRDAAAITRSAEACGKRMRVLDAALTETPWLSGTDFGVGDIPMGVYAHTWFSLDIERPDCPNVSAWYERLKQRPGYTSQVMIPLT